MFTALELQKQNEQEKKKLEAFSTKIKLCSIENLKRFYKYIVAKSPGKDVTQDVASMIQDYKDLNAMSRKKIDEIVFIRQKEIAEVEQNASNQSSQNSEVARLNQMADIMNAGLNQAEIPDMQDMLRPISTRQRKSS